MRRAALLVLLLGSAGVALAAEPGGGEGSTGRLLLQALAGLVVVVGLVVLTRQLLLRLPGGAHASVRLREVVRLPGQQALYVVEVEGRRLLLGQHVHLLYDLGPAPVEPRAVAFGQRLRKASRWMRGVRGEEP